MPIASDLASAAALVSTNEKTQLNTASVKLKTLVKDFDTVLDGLPDTGGAPSGARQFVQKVRDNVSQFDKEGDYLLNLFPPKA
jgi:hypothetical protein